MSTVVTIRDRRQITFPKELMKELKLQSGDKLFFKKQKGNINIEPIKKGSIDLLTKMRQIAKKSNISLSDLQKEGKRIRKELVEDYYS